MNNTVQTLPDSNTGPVLTTDTATMAMTKGQARLSPYCRHAAPPPPPPPPLKKWWGSRP